MHLKMIQFYSFLLLISVIFVSCKRNTNNSSSNFLESKSKIQQGFECNAFVLLIGDILNPVGKAITPDGLFEGFLKKARENGSYAIRQNITNLDLSEISKDKYSNYCVFVFAHGKMDNGKYKIKYDNGIWGMRKCGWIVENSM